MTLMSFYKAMSPIFVWFWHSSLCSPSNQIPSYYRSQLTLQIWWWFVSILSIDALLYNTFTKRLYCPHFHSFDKCCLHFWCLHHWTYSGIPPSWQSFFKTDRHISPGTCSICCFQRQNLNHFSWSYWVMVLSPWWILFLFCHPTHLLHCSTTQGLLGFFFLESYPWPDNMQNSTDPRSILINQLLHISPLAPGLSQLLKFFTLPYIVHLLIYLISSSTHPYKSYSFPLIAKQLPISWHDPEMSTPILLSPYRALN